jgi:hypothetical protein
MHELHEQIFELGEELGVGGEGQTGSAKARWMSNANNARRRMFILILGA